MSIEKLLLKSVSGEITWPMWKLRVKFALNSYADALELFEGKLVKRDQLPI